MNKKGLANGMVTGLIFGIAALIIGVLIAFVVTSTLNSADLIDQETGTVTNESGWVNKSGYTLSESTYSGANTFAITSLFNATDDTPIELANASVSAVGLVKNATAIPWNDALISYTYLRDTDLEITQKALTLNFTKGVDNVSSKLPTILLVAGIILILGILGVLVAVWQRMRMGGGGSL